MSEFKKKEKEKKEKTVVGASIIQVFLAREDVRMLRELSLYLTPRRTRKVIPPPWYGVGGLDGPP